MRALAARARVDGRRLPRCGLHRREEWLLDRRPPPVMALVWTDRSGDRQIQPFPPMRGVLPPAAPTRTREEAFPGLPVGPEPPCQVGGSP